MTHNQQQDDAVKKNFLARLWGNRKRPSTRYSLVSLLTIGFVAGILAWGSFNWAMEITNTETFCISCHEMEENVYQEYQDTIHYNNRTGVRATCPDCHVPKEWIHKVVRKIQATNELYHKIIGSVDTPEKFEAKRLELARHVWASMKASDSRECRNCHDNESMDYTKQGRRAVPQHIKGTDNGQTCIDCHKGIAHSLPALYEIDPSAAIGGN
jgi:cytochrome c-type protein NapC